MLRFLFGSEDDTEWKRQTTYAKQLITGIALIAIGCALVAYMGSPPPVSQEKRPYCENKKQSDLENQIDGCLVVDSANKQRTIDHRNENDFIKDKRDLNAQEGVWRATNLVAFLTIFATGLASIGVYFLYKTMVATNETLSQAREATIATKESSRGQMAAVDINHTIHTTFDPPNKGTKVYKHTFTFTVDNVGQGAAFSSSVKIGGKEATTSEILIVGEGDWEAAQDDVIDIFPALNSPTERKTAHVLEDNFPKTTKEKTYFAWCIINYTDIFGTERRSTATFTSSEVSPKGEMIFKKQGFTDIIVNSPEEARRRKNNEEGHSQKS